MIHCRRGGACGQFSACMHAGYQSLYEVARSRGAEVRFWEPRYDAAAARGPGDAGRLVFDVADLEALVAAADNLAVVAVNFPHNPTGAMLAERELRAVVDAVCGQGAWLFSDEMYRGLGAPAPLCNELGHGFIAAGGHLGAAAVHEWPCGWS